MIARQFSLIFLLVAAMVGCGAKSTASPPTSFAETLTESTAAPPTPATYQRKQFSPDEIAALDDALPKKVRDVLERAGELEVFSISSNPKTVVIADAAAKSEVLDAFFAGIVEPAHMAGCFKPHHGIRAKHGGDEVEIKICFMCKNFWGHSRREGRFSGRVGPTPEATFNRVLGLPDEARGEGR